MLSPANMFLLGTIDAKPVNPYEIVSRFEFNHFKDIFNIAESTIYTNIRTMNRKGFIEYQLEYSESMPAKKVYSITEKGKKELKESLREYLENYTSDLKGFSVALLLMHFFEKEELLQMLENHKMQTETYLKDRKDDYEFIQRMNNSLPCVPDVICSLQVYLLAEIEMKVVCNAIQMLKDTEQWPQSTFEVEDEYFRLYSDMINSNKN